ncbi:MAG: MmgE/PrpD family protein [SAR202 cluster bacterium]|nr:MmgE/PrpD family protein [SAR202 cluster bacterium]
MGVTQRLAEWVRAATFEDLPAEVVEQSKSMMLNAAAVALAGAAQPESRAVTQFLQEMRGNGKCTIIGMGLRTSPVFAALANGMMVRLLDFDDELPQSGLHPSSAVFPVVMALGEMSGYSGKEVLTAFALGCEAAAKLSAAGGQVSGGLQSWPADGVAGTLGAAAAAARLLKLDQAQTEQALGLAAGQAGGITASQATPGEAFQCGRAAMQGLIAAMLAQQGMGGARNAIEAPGGLLHNYGQWDLYRTEPQQAALLASLGSPWDVVQPGITLKVYPCHSAAHTSIEAVRQLMQQYRLLPAQVEAVRVSVAPAALQALPLARPSTGWEARSSLAYMVAAALLQGQPLLESFTDAAVQDPRVSAMVQRVTVAPEETPTASMPLPCSVAATVTGGRVIHHRAEFARGQPELPLEPPELDAKFLYCTRYILPPDHIEGAIGQFRDLENVADITGLASILGG